jgi:adenylate cyclase
MTAALTSVSTVVFADMVGSTAMFERLGDEAATRCVTQLMAQLRLGFEAFEGRIVKVLGDGVFVVFASEGQAVAASISVQQQLQSQPLLLGGGSAPTQLQIGIDSGEVVHLDGDCFGDTVNCAARLSDLAGAGQILTTDKVWAGLVGAQRSSLRSMGAMYLRGKGQASHVYQVQWNAASSGADSDATLVSRSIDRPALGSQHSASLNLSFAGKTLTLQAHSRPLTVGRDGAAQLVINDQRVSRAHASLVWRGGQFVLVDTSSYGTWVYLGNQAEPVVLRRTECVLVGSGKIVPGCERSDADAPTVDFSVKN